MSEREQWSYNNKADWYDGELSVTIREDGSAYVEVTQEQAVDSYNQEFTCAATLPPEKARELGEMLLRTAGTKAACENLGENRHALRREI